MSPFSVASAGAHPEERLVSGKALEKYKERFARKGTAYAKAWR